MKFSNLAVKGRLCKMGVGKMALSNGKRKNHHGWEEGLVCSGKGKGKFD